MSARGPAPRGAAAGRRRATAPQAGALDLSTRPGLVPAPGPGIPAPTADAPREPTSATAADAPRELASPSREFFDPPVAVLYESKHGGKPVLFVALPRSAWRPILGGCGCVYCTADKRTAGPAWWDTLVVPVDGGKTWTCHGPEYHGAKPRRSEP